MYWSIFVTHAAPPPSSGSWCIEYSCRKHTKEDTDHVQDRIKQGLSFKISNERTCKKGHDDFVGQKTTRTQFSGYSFIGQAGADTAQKPLSIDGARTARVG
jgi:hypothetical protein